MQNSPVLLRRKMPDFTDMLSKAKEMQAKMKAAQDLIKNIEVEGEAGGNLVKVILTGDYEIKAIIVSEEAKKESGEIINDLIIAAYNNAKEKLKKKSSEELAKATGGLNIPFDLKFPF
jgi:DNA-binding YbaB/EbfC family protein